MRKIAIITFHRADNLGAVLQSYALQKTLREKYSVDAEILDYRCSGVESNSTKHSGIKGLAMRGYRMWKHLGFQRFRQQYLLLSTACTKDNVRECAQQYDTFITGSDQVWNYECSGWDDGYFLDFVLAEKKKYSYAASIGNYRYLESEQRNIAVLLAGFQGISVREESAKKTLESMGVKNIDTHPDPVILLTEEHWKRIMSRRLCRQRYVFVYLIQQDVNVLRNAEEYAKKHGCKLINNKTSPEFILHGSPCDFLSWINYADCVFTNSFHGTAFSLLLNKSFAGDIALASGGINRRVKEILEYSGAQQCIIQEDRGEPCIPNAMEALNSMREKAYCYLEEICSGR